MQYSEPRDGDIVGRVVLRRVAVLPDDTYTDCCPIVGTDMVCVEDQPQAVQRMGVITKDEEARTLTSFGIGMPCRAVLSPTRPAS